MRKAITPVISVVLLIMLTIVASAGAFFFVNNIGNDLEGNIDTGNVAGSDTSKLNLVSISGTTAIVRNDGTSPVTEVSVFVNGELINYTLDSPINPGEVGEIPYDAQNIGEDLEVKIIYNDGKISQLTSYADSNTGSSGFSTPAEYNPLSVSSVSITNFNNSLIGYCQASSSEDTRFNYEYAWVKDDVTELSGSYYGDFFDSNLFSTCANNGTDLICWGDNNAYKFLKTHFQNLNEPELSFEDYNFSKISLGIVHGCGIRSNDSKLMCWGSNQYGKLGNGSLDNFNVMTPIQINNEYTFRDININEYHSCGVLTNGSAMCWGDNGEGQLGDNTLTDNGNPVFVQTDYIFSSIYTGRMSTCAILTNGSVACWGVNTMGSIGDGTTTERHTPVLINDSGNYTKVSIGWMSTCAIRTDGRVKCWGYNGNGLLGIGTGDANKLNPTLIDDEESYIDISVSWYHACGVRSNLSLACWGRNNYGQLGDGTTTTRLSPTSINSSQSFLSVISGGGVNSIGYSCGLTNLGKYYCWGYNSAGELGQGYSEDNNVIPRIVDSENNYTTIAVGYATTCGIRQDDNKAYCWGDNGYGQLGDGTTSDKFTSNQINDDSEYSMVGVANLASCGLLTNGSVKCWGYNNYGQLGDGTTTNHYNPDFINDTNEYISISMSGFGSTCGILTNGSIACWGHNGNGQLGDGTKDSILNPKIIDSINNYSKIVVDYGNTCGLLTNGSVLCWGSNSYGQIGDNTTTERLTPTFVLGDNVFVDIGTANGRSCGLLANGTVLCWGNSYDLIPSTVNGSSSLNFTQVDVLGPICAITNESKVYCWGINTVYGTLGYHTIMNEDVTYPRMILNTNNFNSIHASNSAACAIDENNKIYCWGHNDDGFLGFGSLTYHNPTLIDYDDEFYMNEYLENNLSISTLPNSYVTGGDSWTLKCRVTDGSYTSNWTTTTTSI